MGHNNCFPKKLLLVISLFSTMFVLHIMFSVLVGSLYEDVGEDPGSWTHVNSTLSEELE